MLVCRAEQAREAPSRASAGPLLFPHMTSARNPRDPILPCRPGWTLASPLRPHARNQRKALVRNPHVVGAARTPVSGARFSRKARAGARGAGRIPPWQGARRLERAGACKARVSSAPVLAARAVPSKRFCRPCIWRRGGARRRLGQRLAFVLARASGPRRRGRSCPVAAASRRWAGRLLGHGWGSPSTSAVGCCVSSEATTRTAARCVPAIPGRALAFAASAAGASLLVGAAVSWRPP